MNPLYAYSLLPVVAISLLLFFTLVLRVRRHWGVAMYCGSTFVWASALLVSYFPALSELGSRAAAVGAFVAASYVHAAYDFTQVRRTWLMVAAYGVAGALTVVGFFVPGVLYNPVTLDAGPFFWPGMGLAIAAALLPLYDIFAEFRRSDALRRRNLGYFLVAGVVGYIGAWGNALMLSNGIALPYGMLLVLASLLMLGAVVQDVMPATDRRLMERSIAYSAVTAFLSAGFLLGIYWFIEDQELLRGYRVGALFLIFLAAWAFDPIRQQVMEIVGARIEPDRAHAADLARELVKQEERTAHAERLAELGQFTSAIAHEIRNPLGVLTAHLKLLERNEAVSQETVDQMRAQIDRASHFVDDLLAYGRPTPLNLRESNLGDIVALAATTAAQALNTSVDVFDNETTGAKLEADHSQLLQVFVVLFENALLAGATSVQTTWTVVSGQLRIDVVDNGSGVPEAVVERLFEPFVTSRKRDNDRPGTGLGLAIARGIVERHGGKIELVEEPDHDGAHLRLELPQKQLLPADGA